MDAFCHVRDNADSLGIDKNKIALAGISGGGWICMGAVNLIAKAGLSHQVKCVMCQTAMLSDESKNMKPEDLW